MQEHHFLEFHKYSNKYDFWLIDESEESKLVWYENQPNGYFTAEMTECDGYFQRFSKWCSADDLSAN